MYVHHLTRIQVVSAPLRETVSLSITANQIPIVTITLPEDGITINPGESLGFQGTANDAEDGSLSSQINWASSLDGSLGMGASISANTLTEGNHTITASVQDQQGQQGQTSILVHVGIENGTIVIVPLLKLLLLDDGYEEEEPSE